MKIKAVGHRVIVKPDAVEEVSKGGIVLAVDHKREIRAADKGTVVGIGSMAWKNDLYGYGKDGWEPWCKEGDRVFFARYAGKGFKDGDTNYIVLNDEDIQCQILEEDIDGDRDDD